MPNHVTTQIRVSPEVAEAIVRRHTEQERIEHEQREAERKQRFVERGREDQYQYEPLDMEKRFVDFGLVIPEPEDMFHGGCDMNHPHPKEGGGFYEHCWYGWNVQNWGTKWNAYDTEVSPAEGDLCVVRFDTAWSHPLPVIEALSMKFPTEVLDVMFADEDLGHNLGAYSMKDGVVLKAADIEEGSDEAHELAAQIKYQRSYAELQKEWNE